MPRGSEGGLAPLPTGSGEIFASRFVIVVTVARTVSIKREAEGLLPCPKTQRVGQHTAAVTRMPVAPPDR